MNFADRLKRARMLKGLSKKDLAEKLGVSKYEYSQLEGGARHNVYLGWQVERRIERILKVDLNWLETGIPPREVTLYLDGLADNADPDDVLRGAIGLLQGVVIAGYDKSGEIFFASSYAYGSESLWVLKQAERELLSGEPEREEPVPAPEHERSGNG